MGIALLLLRSSFIHSSLAHLITHSFTQIRQTHSCRSGRSSEGGEERRGEEYSLLEAMRYDLIDQNSSCSGHWKGRVR